METEIIKLIGFMAAAYPNTQVSAQTLKVYAQGLKDIPLATLDAAVEQCILESEFFPTLAKLRAKAADLTTPRRQLAPEAYGDLLREISKTGYYRTPHFDDPLVTRVVNALGWQNLCTSENQVADRARFIQMYDALLEREIEDARLGPKARALRQITDAQGDVKEIGDGRGF